MNAVEEILFFVSVFRQFGVPVEFEPGWERRGNGSSAAYEGSLLHHTGIPASYDNPGPGTRVLRDGRPDLSGPLCQFQNKFNGVVRVIAAHPANHAGAGNGRSMGPLPRTRLFNPRVVGMETDYAGNSPMSPEQYFVSKVFAIATKWRYGSIERCRLHFETSEEGKWDAGFKPGTPINADQFRRDALALEASGGHFQEDDVSADAVLNAMYKDPDTGVEYPLWAWVVFGNKKAEWLGAEIVALRAAVEASTNDSDITSERMEEIVNSAIQRHVQITGTVTIASIVEQAKADAASAAPAA